MNTTELLDYAEEEGYTVIYGDFPECASLSSNFKGGVVGLDLRVRGRGEHVRLAHELGHCETGSFYYREMPGQCRQRLENMADSWAYYNVAPPDEIQTALNAGIIEVWDLAEHFGVTDEFMSGALTYYTERRGVVFEQSEEYP